MRLRLILLAVAAAAIGCGDDTADTTVQDLPGSVAGFDLAEGSVRENGVELTATYRDRNGGGVELRVLAFDSSAAASAELREEAERLLEAGFDSQDEQVARTGGRLVVMSRSPGVQARPPDFAYMWTDDNVFASTSGVGEAAGRLYNALPE